MRGFGRQFDDGAKLLRQHECAARIGQAPQGLVQRSQQTLAKAARKPVARQRQQIADAAGADGGQGFFLRALQHRQGQGGKFALEQGGIGYQALLAGACEPGRGAGRGRGGEVRAVAHGGEPLAQPRRDLFQAAEQLQAARYFQQHQLGKIECDIGRALHRPGGDAEQGFGFCRGVAFAQAQARRERQRRSDRHARAQAARGCLAVAHQEALPLGDRARLRRGQAALERFQRQLRQI